MDSDLEYKFVQPDKVLANFVDSFWLLKNHSNTDKQVVVLPDGRMDLFFSLSTSEPFHVTLSGLETQPDTTILAAGTTMFAISFKLLAAEYLFQNTIATLLNQAIHLPAGFWEIDEVDLNDFDLFCKKATQKMLSILPKEMDARKERLFDFVYSSNGMITVKELSEKVFWSSRQINRYFNHQFGLSLKAYCNILRFRASFQHIKNGKLFPQQEFADQSHFIKEVKKLSGVSPKELKRNQNDRFIQFSTLASK